MSIGVHIGTTWQVQLNRPYAAAMKPYIKLLWSIVITKGSVDGPQENFRECW